MSKTRIALAALAATCVMGLSASSASAAITVGPGAGPWATTVTFPAPGGFTFGAYGFTFGCSATMTASLSNTGAMSVSALTVPPCAGGTWTSHPPFSGQIVGSPGNYKADIPISFDFKAFGGPQCLYSGTLRVPLTSGSSSVGSPGGHFTSNCGSSLTVTNGWGSISPVKAINGSL